jgi:hypothetical protein
MAHQEYGNYYNDNESESDNENDNYDDVERRRVDFIVNNGGLIIGRPGNEGRYTFIAYITSGRDWYNIFDHVVLPQISRNTIAYIQAQERIQGDGELQPELFPEVVMIPLPSRTPGFRRCIFHIEEVEIVNNDGAPRYQLTGRYIPVYVAYHMNHPIAEEVDRVFGIRDPVADTRFYQSNDMLLQLTSYNEDWIRQMAHLLVQPGDNFAGFSNIISTVVRDPAANVLVNPVLVERANREVLVPYYDANMEYNADHYELWRAIVYPEFAEEQQREAYEEYAVEQVSMHCCRRLEWERENPNLPNRFEMPFDEDGRENNPADRAYANNNGANAYIRELFAAQNNQQRERILAAAADIREVVVASAALPANRVIGYDG